MSGKKAAPQKPAQRKQRSLLLRPTKRDDRIALGLALVAVVALLGVFLLAPARHVAHTVAQKPEQLAALPATPPTKMLTGWTTAANLLAGLSRPVVADGIIISARFAGSDPVVGSPAFSQVATVVGIDPQTGTELWTYERKETPLCQLTSAFNLVIAIYRTGAGCGDVVALDPQTGEYHGTRSAQATMNPGIITSNDAIGLVAPERLELWRNDLVRTLEYGTVWAPQEAGKQPYADCKILSALTRKQVVATTESCPDHPGVTMLRIQKRDPADSRAPEVSASQELRIAGAVLVGVGQQAVTVYIPDPQAPRLEAYSLTGQKLGVTDLKEKSPQVTAYLEDNDPAAPVASFIPVTADLPHHMQWFDGRTLFLLHPTSMLPECQFADAVGTGVAWGNQLVYPTAAGLAVADWTTCQQVNTIAVDRGGYAGSIGLNLAQDALVENRFNSLVGLFSGSSQKN